MAVLEVHLATSGAAFENHGDFEVSRILRELADRIENQGLPLEDIIRLKDTNGNRVGYATAVATS